MTPFQLPRHLIDKPTRHGDSPNYTALSILNKLRSENRCSGIRWLLAIGNKLGTGCQVVGRLTERFISPRLFTANANGHWPFMGCTKIQTDRCWSSALEATVRSQATSCAVFVGYFLQVFLFLLRSFPVTITPPMTHNLSFTYRLGNCQHS